MKFRIILASLFLSVSAFAQASGDSSFLAARDAFRDGDMRRLEQALENIGGHPLAIHAENYRLRLLMARNDTSGIPAFLARHEGTLVAERLRADWLRWLDSRDNPALIEREYRKLLAPEAEARCIDHRARFRQGDPNALPAALPLWWSQLEPTDPCQRLFEALAAAGVVDDNAIWTRARLQWEMNRPTQAQRTLAFLNESRRPDQKTLDQAVKNAMSTLSKQSGNWHETRTGREITAVALRYLAASDPLVAARELEKRQARLQRNEAQWAWSQIALQGARKHLPEAQHWYAQAGNTPLSDENHQWKVRAALRAQAWGEVRAAIEAMPASLAERPEWVYWLGRAYKAGGRHADADRLFARIAGQTHFYGNLADEELGRQIAPPPKAAATTPDELRQAQQHPALQRALRLFQLDMRTEAVREWNWALRGMSDRELLAAAELARRHQLWDRAINTADRTRQEHDFTLRFLSPFDDQIRPVAQQQAVDDAWVYGLMRQESRFITNAKSSVGASGLMQLMPATARWVAKKIGLQDFHPGRVNDTEVNVLLGTSYMRLVMENLDNHPVLASAAYNAGPSRAKRWRASQPLEGAIYAETIPFSETRDYVKKVMSNAVYYSALFNGRPDSLKARLGTIAPANGEAFKDRDLP